MNLANEAGRTLHQTPKNSPGSLRRTAHFYLIQKLYKLNFLYLADWLLANRGVYIGF